MHAVIRTPDQVFEPVNKDWVRLEVLYRQPGFIEVREYDRGVWSTVLTTSTGCKIDVKP